MYDHSVASHRAIQLSFTVEELAAQMMKPVENRRLWFVDKRKASSTVRRGRSERTENGVLLEGFSRKHQEKERSHRSGGLQAYDEALGEYSGTIDPLGGLGGHRDLGRARA